MERTPSGTPRTHPFASSWRGGAERDLGETAGSFQRLPMISLSKIHCFQDLETNGLAFTIKKRPKGVRSSSKRDDTPSPRRLRLLLRGRPKSNGGRTGGRCGPRGLDAPRQGGRGDPSVPGAGYGSVATSDGLAFLQELLVTSNGLQADSEGLAFLGASCY